MIFVDTGAWFAAFVPNDPDHAAADAWLGQNDDLLVTTDYVVDELLTLMKCRGEFERAIGAGALVARRLGCSTGMGYARRRASRLADLPAIRRQGVELYRLRQ